MKDLQKILGFNIPQIPDFTTDDLQESVLRNLHLELDLEDSTYLLNPKFQLISVAAHPGHNITAVSNGEKQAERHEIGHLKHNAEFLERLKRYIIINLSLYSDLLETNSYYITNNESVVIVRLSPLEKKSDRDDYDIELRLYTISPNEIRGQYKDKIYLGRDFLATSSLKRRHFGLDNIFHSVIREFILLKNRYYEFVPAGSWNGEINEFLLDIEASVQELGEKSGEILPLIPADVSIQGGTPVKALLSAARGIREVKHLLIEIQSALLDWERLLYRADLVKFGRYVTRYKKDITDYINFATKINNRITGHVNGLGI